MNERRKVVQNVDFRDVILSQREKKTPSKWEGTALDYLNMVHENPSVASFAPGRIYNMIMKHGTRVVPNEDKIRGYEDLVEYKFFDGKIFGTREPIHDIMRFLKAAARRTETGKRILIMVGPVASGKSTIASLIKKGLQVDDQPIYAIKGCPIHEEPLHLIPEEDREEWQKRLGVKIEGDLCPVCQKMIDDEYTTETGIIEWENVPIEQIKLSEQRRCGIGTFQPSDPKSQDVTELIGRVNMSKIALHGETDPRAYQFDGELQVANRGVVEYIEILKADVKFHYILLTAAQEQVIKSPGFPQMYIDTLILSHTNETEFDKFAGNKENEALHDRMYPVYVPWNLKVDDEVKIYKKMIAESDFAGVHIAPGTLKFTAEFAVLTRLIPDPKCTNLIQKMRLYNGDVIDEFRKVDIDVRSLRERGKKEGEGRKGISPRFVINALNVALGAKEDKSCICVVDAIRALRNNFDHSIGIPPEDAERFLNLLIAEKDSVFSEYIEFAKKEVNMSFLHAYEDQANELFKRYMMNVEAYCNKEQIEDSVTGELSDPDEKIMREIEEIAQVPEQSKDTFRNGIFIVESRCLKQGREFTFKDYDVLREAIELKLMNDLKNVVNLSIASTTTDPKAQRRKDRAMANLLEKGYCPHCANMLLKFVGEILRKQS